MADYPHLIPEAAKLVTASPAARFSFIERDKVVHLPLMERVIGRLQELHAHHRILRPPNAAITGPSGIGKSHAVTEFLAQHRPRRSKSTGLLRVPVLHAEYPPFPNSRWLVAEIMRALGFVTPLPKGPEELYSLLLSRLSIADTRLIIVEEVNQLRFWGREHLREFYGLIRWLSNQSQIPIALVGTEEVLEIINGDIQLVRRFERVELHPLPLDREFEGFVCAYLRTIPLPAETIVDETFAALVHEASRGITDTIVKVLQRAGKKAILLNRERIQLDDIEADAELPPPLVAQRKILRNRGRRR